MQKFKPGYSLEDHIFCSPYRQGELSAIKNNFYKLNRRVKSSKQPIALQTFREIHSNTEHFEYLAYHTLSVCNFASL